MSGKPTKPNIERTVALCYVRRSLVRDEKDLVSPEIQRQNIMRVCQAHGWEPEFYEDVEKHKSGLHEKNRPGWLALKARLNDPDIVALVANDLSRLHRKGWRIGDLLDFVDQHGIKLVLADPNKQIDFSTPHGRMIAQLSAIFDEWYAMDVSIRRKANIAYRKSQNKTVGRPPFGTKRNTDGYLIPSSEGVWLLPNGQWIAGTTNDAPPADGAVWRGYFDCAEQVLRFFSQGYNRSQICEELSAQGYAFRGADGQPALIESDDVRRITHNWVEYGGAVMDKHSISRHYEELDLDSILLDPARSVFDLGLLRQVADQLVARSTRKLGKGRRKKAITYSLSSMIYCAHCEALAQKHSNQAMRSRLISRSRGAYFVHRPGIKCGRSVGQVATRTIENDFASLVKQLTIDEAAFAIMIRIAGETCAAFQEDRDLEARKSAAIAKCERKLQAAKHLYEDGEISREEYLRRKEENYREITHWSSYTTETQRITTHLLLCVEALAKLSELWEASTSEDRNRLARSIFEYVVFDLDTQRIVDFKLNPLYEQFLILRAEVHEQADEAECLKCDPGRIRTYDTPLKRRVLCH